MNAERGLRDPQHDRLDDHAREQIEAALAAHRGRPGPLLQVLHTVQDSLGYIPPAAVPLIAEVLNLSRAEVHGVVTFYHHFRHAPAGRHIIQLCQAEACRSVHCEKLTEYAQRKLGVALHETTADGRYTLEPVYCLGNCACGPAAMIDDELLSRVTPESFDALIATLS
jgi:formate dehydrogenase subunit gamma